MKICALTDMHPTDPWDASDTAMHAVLAAFAEAGHETIVLSENAALVDRERHDGVLYMPTGVASAFPALSALKPEAIIGHREAGRHGGRYAEYLNIPYVLMIQGGSPAEERESAKAASLVLFTDVAAQDAFGEAPQPDFYVLSESGEGDVVSEVEALVGI